MKVRVLKPAATEAELEKGSDPSTVIEVRPRRWTKKQQVLTVIPVEVVRDSGEVLDNAVLTVNQRTGVLALTRVSTAEIDCDADTGGE